MIIPMLFLAGLGTMDVCTASLAPSSADDGEVTIIGRLVFSRHSAHLIGLGRTTEDRGGCKVFTIFPGTPAFLTPGVTDQEGRRDPKLAKFVQEYKAYTDRETQRPKEFAVKGRLRIKKDFALDSDGSGNGFGYRGSFRAALVVSEVEEIQVRQGTTFPGHR
jgi:hypothetical protein